MNKIVRKEQFSEKVFLFEIEAPLIAKSRNRERYHHTGCTDGWSLV